jgi:GH15 family glucan-1,4-alpha-glucosidase
VFSEGSASYVGGHVVAALIDDYGLIGDTRGSALITKSADIDWWCAPRFDSEACFAALLGRDEHGRWGLRPTEPVLSRAQRYRHNTMVLETEFTCAHGSARVVDFMPVADGRSDLVRIVEGCRARSNWRLGWSHGSGKEHACRGCSGAMAVWCH